MLPAPIPDYEQERLADLRALKILDTKPEERFDRIVTLAADIFHAPIAYIALIDSDRQWFKAKCGLTANQTDRSISFCGHAILHTEPLVIPDTTLDERFHDSPLVTQEPHVRFYAGHPLAGPSGQNVGTLCIADRKPRNIDSLSLETFSRLAALAEHELNMLDLITVQRDLIDTQTRLLRMQERMQQELQDAERYVRTLLPPPIHESGLRIHWRFESSSALGGDIFGYHWLDDDHLALYVADVMGHGVGAALLASSVQTALRRQTLPATQFNEPVSVLRGLNAAFPMALHADRFFTAWYGVLNRRTRELRYASGGHPSALMLDPSGGIHELKSTGTIVGLNVGVPIEQAGISLQPGARLYLMTDGVVEVRTGPGALLGVEGLSRIIRGETSENRVDAIHEALRAMQASEPFEDDFSLIEVLVE
ncbi:Phosphoserine phosphatase RsbP [Phycisphaerae bacterium RAS2]|nr:Phosphoserine phosphatase RsbP [Phycisphaerae bacterium RAS2]